jgi:hypothetical protein
MNAIAAFKPIIQEGIEQKPGYCEDPLSPLWQGGHSPESGIAAHLYETARNIDEWGQSDDWITSFLEDVDSLKKDLFSWYLLALRAWKIKIFKSYREHCKTFQEFCERFLGCSQASINQKIRAARVLSQLISLGFERLPRSPSICHELMALGWEDLGDTWRDICDKYEDHEITAEKVRLCISDPFGETPTRKQIRIPFRYYEKAREQAAIADMSFNDFVESLFENYLGETSHDDGLRANEPLERDWPVQRDNSDEKEGLSDGNLPTNSQESGAKGSVDYSAIALSNAALSRKTKVVDYELFRATYNENKPKMWAEWFTINDTQKRKISQSIKECGNEENALIALSNALKYAASDSWWSSKKLTFLAIVRDGRLTEFHEKFIDSETTLSPSEQRVQDNIAFLRRMFPDAD